MIEPMAPPAPNRPSPDELQRLYVDDRMTSTAIADRCGVSKITVLRWLKAARIERRAVGRGLANRGHEAPTGDALHRLVHEEHLSYREIAERYEVDASAIPYWLDAHGIEKPTIWATRRKGATVTEPDDQELRRRVAAGESLRVIAADFTISETRLTLRCKKLGLVLPPSSRYGRSGICADGHRARSTYELRVDDWLYEHGITHEVEPRYPFNRRFRADFLVGDTFVEVWGVARDRKYTERREWKVSQCREHGITLIEISWRDFETSAQWWKPLERLLPPSAERVA